MLTPCSLLSTHRDPVEPIVDLLGHKAYRIVNECATAQCPEGWVAVRIEKSSLHCRAGDLVIRVPAQLSLRADWIGPTAQVIESIVGGDGGVLRSGGRARFNFG